MKSTPNVSLTSSKDSIKSSWDLSLLYKSPQDPQIEKDLKAYERMCDDFERNYKEGKQYLQNNSDLEEILHDYELLYSTIEGNRPIAYFHYIKELDSSHAEAEAMVNKFSARLSKATNKILFFELDLGKISEERQEKLLDDKKLQKYHYFLQRIFLTARHALSEPEEKILNLVSLPGNSMWLQGQSKLLSQQTVVFKEKILPIAEAMNIQSTLNVKDRRIVAKLVVEKLKSISFFAESEMTAVYTNKKINDELRGFEQPYSSTILGYQNDEKSIINFAQTVTDNFSISHRFYALKGKLSGLKKLEYADRSSKIGNFTKKFDFKESIKILTSAFDKVDPEFSAMLISYLEKGQIDVYPKKGKHGGAYCSGISGLPTFVLLNHVDTLDSLKTFAHEMGHAIHTEFSKSQPPLYENYTISAAEVASTLFENFAFQEVFETLNPQQKIIALHDRLNDFVATIFRQIACFNYEVELHQTLKEKGSLSAVEMASLHNKHMKAYLGPRFNLNPDDGYFFVAWPHLRRFFYVYSYAYGSLISTAMYRRYLQDKTYVEKIKQFLKAGGSNTPEEIFKSIGIDTSNPGFFEEGLKLIEEDIEKLEKLIKITNRKK